MPKSSFNAILASSDDKVPKQTIEGLEQESVNTFWPDRKKVINSRNPNISWAYNFMENTLYLSLNFRTTMDSSKFLAQNCMKLST